MSVDIFFAELCKWLLVFTLLFGAVAKTKSFTNFNQALIDGLGLQQQLGLVLSVVVIFCEYLIGFMIVFSANNNIAFILTLALLIAFTIFLSWAIVNNKDISCNCFGEKDQPINKYDLLRNAVFISAAIFCLISQTEKQASLVIQIQAATLACLTFILLIHLKETFTLIMHKSLGNS